MAERKTVVTADGIVQAGKGYYYGYIVTTTMSANLSTIYDNTEASGTVIDTIASGAAQGTRVTFATPVPVSKGIYVDVGGTGTVVILHD